MVVNENSEAFLQNTLLFTRMLRQVGLPVSLEQTMDFTRALTLIDIGVRDQVFHAARCLLVTQHQHLKLFETIFNRFWDKQKVEPLASGQKMPIAPRHKRQRRKPFTVVNYMAYQARQSDEEIDVADRSETYSSVEVLQRKEFSHMTAEELQTIKRLMQDMRWQVSLRRTRRRVSDPKGNLIHLRQVMRSATKYGGTPLALSWQSRKIKQRPFILIADISGSMEKYARLMLQFFYTVSHSLRDVECFVFGTRLTRITLQLKLKNIDSAVAEASSQVIDWSGGTRIGESLRSFNRRWGRRVLRRGAIVLVVSDGWERGDVRILRQEMRYLQHRCHRLIWLNPLLGKTTYQPTVSGMEAALPFVDDFLPVHNLQSLSALSIHLSTLGQRRSVNDMPKRVELS
ncbi:MAG: VWA domain-containing protein [Chloroflexi bacterium]|jgi:uncharacterized protein with von Willebrand factor type A (vWA) domain|nr:VWA domain-containing protein [Chloroflexota bacterium]